jgi:hypothetical protein
MNDEGATLNIGSQEMHEQHAQAVMGSNRFGDMCQQVQGGCDSSSHAPFLLHEITL